MQSSKEEEEEKLSGGESKKTTSFKNHIKNKTKYLEINIAKGVKGLYSENFRILKEIEHETKNSKDIPCSWIERINSLNVHTIQSI